MGQLAVVEGEAFVRAGSSKNIQIEIFEESFVLGDDVKDIHEARSIIKNGLLSDRLKKTMKDYKKFRTYDVVSFEATDDEVKNSEYEALMIEAVKKQCVPENLDVYSGEDGKSKALKRAIKSKDKRVAADKAKKSAVKDQGLVD